MPAADSHLTIPLLPKMRVTEAEYLISARQKREKIEGRTVPARCWPPFTMCPPVLLP